MTPDYVFRQMQAKVAADNARLGAVETRFWHLVLACVGGFAAGVLFAGGFVL